MFIRLKDDAGLLNAAEIARAFPVGAPRRGGQPRDPETDVQDWIVVDRKGKSWQTYETEVRKLLPEQPEDTLIPASAGQRGVVVVHEESGKVTVEETRIIAWRVYKNPDGLLFVHAVPIRQFPFPRDVGVLLEDGSIEGTWQKYKDRDAFAAASAEARALYEREFGHAESGSATPEAGAQVH